MTRCLISGVSGFFCAQLFEHIMVNTDWHVVGLHRSSRAGSLQRIEEVLSPHPEWRERLTIVHHDLQDAVSEFVSQRVGEVDIIIHAAASSHVDLSITHPMQFCLDNVVGTVNLLEYARTLPNLKLFLYFSTDESFGNALGDVSHNEEAPHRPRNPYAAAKAGAEDFTLAYGVTYRLPIMVTHTMNLFGERQHYEKMIPLVMRKIMLGELLSIHADPTCTIPGRRHYLHCRNAAAALLYIIEHGEIGGIYNVVGEKELDNLQLAKIIEGYVHEWLMDRTDMRPEELPELKYELVSFHASRPGHDLVYRLDGTKLRNMGYVHPSTFEESLRKTVFWMMDHKHDWLGL